MKQDLTRSRVLAALASAVPLRWLTTPEAGSYLKLSPKTLERMRSENLGPRYHVAGARTVRYDIAELDAWLRREEVAR